MIILTRACTQGGWAHRQRVSTTFLTRKISQIFYCAPDAGGVRTSDLLDLWVSNPTLYRLSHLVSPHCLLFAAEQFVCAAVRPARVSDDVGRPSAACRPLPRFLPGARAARQLQVSVSGIPHLTISYHQF